MNACPNGWHLPSNAEWNTLVDIAGGAWEAGNILKASSGWEDNSNGTDEYGFSALPGGSYSSYNGFSGVGNSSNWWLATEYKDGASHAWYMEMSYSAKAFITNREKTYLHSVRCVKD